MKRKHLIAITAVLLLTVGATYGYLEFNRGVAGTASLPVQEKVTAGRIAGRLPSRRGRGEPTLRGYDRTSRPGIGHHPRHGALGTGVTNVILETGDDLAGIVCEFPDKELPTDWRAGADVTIRGSAPACSWMWCSCAAWPSGTSKELRRTRI
ncbi:MAG: hypothetical protein H6590_04300 [Flavobacteriales bacterium]|nr:hypothetical protein [Flavobacteriales bacterium]